MKKILVLLSIVLTLFVGGNAFASDDIKIIIDGQSKVFVPGPIIQNDTTIIPMRAFFESLGAKVQWHEDTQTVEAVRSDVTVRLVIGDLEAYVNNEKRYLTVRPQIIQDRTFVPLRFVSEALGADVFWDGDTSTITIKDKTKSVQTLPNLIDTQKYEMQITFELYNNGDQVDLQYQTTVGANSNSPYQKDRALSVTPSPNEVSTDQYGNKYAKNSYYNLDKGQNIDVIITKDLENSGVNYPIDINRISSDYSDFGGYATYTSPQEKIESDNQLIINKAQEICGQETNPYKIAQKIYEYVNLNMTNDTSETYAGKGALSALLTGRGVCQEYSKLFVALLRAKGIPARCVYGFWVNNDIYDKIGYDGWYDITTKGHEWPEFYLPQYGWIVCEPTVAYTVGEEQQVPWFDFANLQKNGHIIWGYYSGGLEGIDCNISGTGRLDVNLKDPVIKIRKVY